MNELAPFHDVHFLETVLDIVLYCLDVVVGDFFNLFHFCCIFRGHGPVYVPESLKLAAVKISELWKRNTA